MELKNINFVKVIEFTVNKSQGNMFEAECCSTFRMCLKRRAHHADQDISLLETSLYLRHLFT